VLDHFAELDECERTPGGDSVDRDSRDRYLGRIKSWMALGGIDRVTIGIHFREKVIKCWIVLKNPHIGNPRVAWFWRFSRGEATPTIARYIDIVRVALRNVNRD
jgi:hypothetical protein